MTIWDFDKVTEISCGVNNDSDLFLGDNRSGYNLRDTEENRKYIKNDYKRYTGKEIK